MLLLAENFIGQGYFRMNFSSMFFSTGMNLKQKDDLSTVHAMVWSNGREVEEEDHCVAARAEAVDK